VTSKIPNVRRNIVANAIGQGWSGLLSIVLIPVYIRLLGVESYGLVGLYITVQAALAVLDFGLAGTINRELARGLTTAGADNARPALSAASSTGKGSSLRRMSGLQTAKNGSAHRLSAAL